MRCIVSALVVNNIRHSLEHLRGMCTCARYLSILVPEEYGGSGLPLSAACAVLEEIHASGGNGGAAHAQMYTMGTLLYHGTEAQKQRWLPGIASGEIRMQAFGVSEPDSGTDTLSLRTTVRPTNERRSTVMLSSANVCAG